MKILHALVGYLAATALPFHLFAFASPLAPIYFDGYVNTTQSPIDGALINYVLGGIVGTCQTVALHSDYLNTTQNRRDSDSTGTDLIKRVPGDIIEARWAALAPPVLVVIAIVVAVTLSIFWVESDDPVSR